MNALNGEIQYIQPGNIAFKWPCKAVARPPNMREHRQIYRGLLTLVEVIKILHPSRGFYMQLNVDCT